jgi:RNA-binding protein YhbY
MNSTCCGIPPNVYNTKYKKINPCICLCSTTTKWRNLAKEAEDSFVKVRGKTIIMGTISCQARNDEILAKKAEDSFVNVRGKTIIMGTISCQARYKQD